MNNKQHVGLAMKNNKKTFTFGIDRVFALTHFPLPFFVLAVMWTVAGRQRLSWLAANWPITSPICVWGVQSFGKRIVSVVVISISTHFNVIHHAYPGLIYAKYSICSLSKLNFEPRKGIEVPRNYRKKPDSLAERYFSVTSIHFRIEVQGTNVREKKTEGDIGKCTKYSQVVKA